jgi:hypothetical protein
MSEGTECRISLISRSRSTILARLMDNGSRMGREYKLVLYYGSNMDRYTDETTV